jgi:hypothetical protein
MMPTATPAAAYIRRETLVSIVINTALTFAFFCLVFGLGRRVAVWGLGNFVFDFGPQAFMIALMATLVPGALARNALRKGLVAPWTGPSRLPAALALRALVMAALSALIAVGVIAALLGAAGWTMLSPPFALLTKLAFAVVLAAIVTPPGLRAALSPRK